MLCTSYIKIKFELTLINYISLSVSFHQLLKFKKTTLMRVETLKSILGNAEVFRGLSD